jgi:hypothetical protein
MPELRSADMTRHIAIAALLALGAGAAQAAGPAETDLTTDHLTVADLDGDGAVSKTEYRVMASNVFIVIDADNDNKLTPAEAPAVNPALFTAMDQDADGLVSRAEYDVQVLADFDAADLDGNGLLN